MGILAGFISTTKHLEHTLDRQYLYFKGETMAHVLKAYDQGWNLSRDHCMKNLYWMVLDCREEMQGLNGRVYEAEKLCGLHDNTLDMTPLLEAIKNQSLTNDTEVDPAQGPVLDQNN
jgi:hypothetical protein